MIDAFVQLLLALNKILFNNLGLTIIVIGIVSRVAFHPLFVQSMKYTKALRDMKPKLDEAKRKHGNNSLKLAAEQSRLFKEHGVNPASGAIGCLSFIVQIGVALLLFNSLRQIVGSGVDTHFFIWDLGKPDVYRQAGWSLPIPGFLVIITAIATFIQSKMVLPEATQPAKTEGKNKAPDFAEQMASSQSLMAYFFPVLILFWGVTFASGLMLYWLVSTLLGIIQQYTVVGPGGLKPWLVRLKMTN